MKRIFYIHSLPPNYIRTRKNIDIFLKLGYEVFFYGSNRAGHKSYNESFLNKSNLTCFVEKRAFPNGIKGIFRFVIFLWNASKRIKGFNPDVIVITNEELYLLVFLLSKRFRSKIILDGIDGLDTRSVRNIYISAILRKYVNYVRRNVCKIVEVEEFRSELRPEFINKTIVIKNTPNVYRIDEQIAFEDKYSDKINKNYIFCSGSLNKNLNGVEELLAVVSDCENLFVIVTGFVSDIDLLKLFEYYGQKVNYLGPIPLEENLYLLSKSIAYFAFYNPEIGTYKLAAPNKVYEAFMFGKPLLINSECVISEFVERNEFGLSSLYHDKIGLRKNIFRILNGFIDESKSLKIREEFKNNYCWEVEGLKWNLVLNQI